MHPEGTLIAVPVRLGALAHWQDGLFGYFVNDDYMALHVPTQPPRGWRARSAPTKDSSSR